MRFRSYSGIAASVLLGIVLVAAATGKLLESKQLLVTEYHLQLFMSPSLASLTSNAVLWLEMAFGLLLMIGLWSKPAAILTVPLVAGFIFTNSWLIANRLAYEPCGCLGIWDRLLQVRMSTLHSLVFDIILLGLVAIVIGWYPGNLCKRKPWFVK